jgi:hypothetical protein
MMNQYVIGCAVLLSLLIICFLLLRRRDLKLSSKVMQNVSPYVFIGALQSKSVHTIIVNVLGDKVPFLINCKDSVNNMNMTKPQFEEYLEQNNNKLPEDINCVIIYCASWSCGAAGNYYESLIQRNIDVSRVYDYKGGLHEWALYSLTMPEMFNLDNLSSKEKATQEESLKLAKDMMHTYHLKDEKKSEASPISTLASHGENVLSNL